MNLGSDKSFFRVGGTFLRVYFCSGQLTWGCSSASSAASGSGPYGRTERGPDGFAAASKWGSWMRPLVGLQAVMNQHMNASLFSLKFFS